MTKTAWELGKSAGLDPKTDEIDDNPFNFRTEDYMNWQEGYTVGLNKLVQLMDDHRRGI